MEYYSLLIRSPVDGTFGLFPPVDYCDTHVHVPVQVRARGGGCARVFCMKPD